MQYPALRPVGAAAGVLIEKGPNSAVKGSGRTIPLAMERRVYRTISNGWGLHRVRRGPVFASDGLSDLMADPMYETLTKRGGPRGNASFRCPADIGKCLSPKKLRVRDLGQALWRQPPCASPPDRRGQLGRRRMTPAGVRLAGGVAKPGSVHCRNPRAARRRGGRLRYARPAPLGRRSRREWSCAEIQR